MTFHDLPESTDDCDFRDPVLGADLVDLLLGDRDRNRDSLLFLPCWPDGRLMSKRHLIITDVPWIEGPGMFVRLWASSDLELRIESRLLLATSHGGLGVPELHRDWLTGATAGVTAAGTPVVGTYVAARDGVHALRLPNLEHA